MHSSASEKVAEGINAGDISGRDILDNVVKTKTSESKEDVETEQVNEKNEKVSNGMQCNATR